MTTILLCAKIHIRTTTIKRHLKGVEKAATLRNRERERDKKRIRYYVERGRAGE